MAAPTGDQKERPQPALQRDALAMTRGIHFLRPIIELISPLLIPHVDAVRFRLLSLRPPPALRSTISFCGVPGPMPRVSGSWARRRERLDFMVPLAERHLRRLPQERGLHDNVGSPHTALGPGIPQPQLLVVALPVLTP
jgi:hypothetical protein